MIGWNAVACIAVICLAATAGVASEVRVDAKPHAIVVEGRGVSAQDAVTRLAEALGTDLQGMAKRPGRTNLTVRAASVEEALRRILGSQSFIVRYASDGTPRRIELLRSAHADSARPRSGTHAAPSDETLGTLLSQGDDVGPADPFAGALAARAPCLDCILEAVAVASDPAARGDALAVFAEALDDERPIDRSLISMVERLDDEMLAEHLTMMAGHEALRVAAQIATQAKSPVLREKMLAVQALLVR